VCIVIDIYILTCVVITSTECITRADINTLCMYANSFYCSYQWLHETHSCGSSPDRLGSFTQKADPPLSAYPPPLHLSAPCAAPPPHSSAPYVASPTPHHPSSMCSPAPPLITPASAVATHSRLFSFMFIGCCGRGRNSSLGAVGGDGIVNLDNLFVAIFTKHLLQQNRD